ncbi:acyltransferase domain-containing protein, partial [Streptomyces triticirhizae]|uniref:acyltransferase domain-containing protein n=1 Tax=Streptomyces triticirhizae TaxID=2483353 RepID=UPI0013157BA0
VVLEEAPPIETSPARVELPVVPWLLSAKNGQALRQHARRLLDSLPETVDPAQVAAALAVGRAQLEVRAAAIGSDTAELREQLRALAEGEAEPLPTVHGKRVFLFTGQGSQRARMGQELYHTFPVYREAFDATCAELDPHLDRPLRSLVFSDNDAQLHETRYAQPALFALQIALFRLLEHHGITPDLMLGHSLGELSAAHCAGILDLPSAASLVATRAALMHSAPTGGAMIAIQATEEELTPHLTDAVSIAATNSPTNTVISGDADAVHAIANHFKNQGRKTSELKVSHAFHSPHMDPILDAFHTHATTLTYHPPTIPLHPNHDHPHPFTPDYWTSHIRHTVRYHQGLHTLHTHHTIAHLTEIGPDPVLTTLAQHTHPNTPTTAPLRTNTPELTTYLTTLTHHPTTNWTTLTTTNTPNLPLPTYPFQ